MTGLIIDSSTDTLILALSTGESRTHDGAAKIGANLFPLIEEFAPANLSFIGVGRGPGSYTGTRAAVAAATGYAQGAGIPLILFPSLLLFLPEGDSAAALEVKGSNEFYILKWEGGTFHETRGALTDEYLLPPFRFETQSIPRITALAKKKEIPSIEGISYLHQQI